MLRRPTSIIAQAASLLGLAACVASGPSTTGKSLEEKGHPDGRGRPLPRWVADVPHECAVGSSGPTLNPRNAIRYARLSAIEALAAGSLEVEVQTISGDGPHGSFEIAAQALSGSIENARVMALWADLESSTSARRRLRRVFALACWPQASVGPLPEPSYPVWLIEPPVEEGRICAAGIAGPTRKSVDQTASVLRDARLALAVALESRIETRLFDSGHGVAKMAREIQPSPSALARAATAQDVERAWLDQHGVGPLGLPGVLYGLVCIED